ncbi:restriction endonuclease subunit S [Streptococcus suis]|uniref:restriction endonuclease subunit S n=1 Tax=Streptococcus suis TaxID=1307 RepID=UPI0037CF958C
MKTNNNIPAYRFQGYTDAWELRKLGEVAEIVMGQSPDSKNYTDNPLDNILVQGNADLRDGCVVPRVWTTQVTKTAEKGDLILSVRAPVGDVGRTNYNVVLGRGVAGIKGNEFIYHLLVKMKLFGYWTKLSTGSTFESINSDDIKNSIILFPSHPEQSAIGTFFSTLDQHITLHQRKLDTLKEQKKTYLKLLFPAKGQTKPALRFQGFEDDWEEVKLGEVCTIQGGNAWKSDSYSLTGEYLVVTIANVTGEYFIDDKKGNRIDINPNEMQYVLNKGDILISLTGNVGRVSKMTESKGVLNQRVGKLTTTANFEFIFSILRTEKFENEMRLASQGAAQANISNKDVLQYMIPLPSLPEQEAIGTFFQTLDQEIAQVEDKLASLKEMKKTLLRKLFV